MEIGAVSQAVILVTKATTAAAMRSGSLPVFATPAMIALMEEAACACIAPFLKEGETTVGTSLNISHTSATPGRHACLCRSAPDRCGGAEALLPSARLG